MITAGEAAITTLSARIEALEKKLMEGASAQTEEERICVLASAPLVRLPDGFGQAPGTFEKMI